MNPVNDKTSIYPNTTPSEGREAIISGVEKLIEQLFEGLSIEELEEIQLQVDESNERNLDTREYALFTNIIGPLLGVTNYHIGPNLKAVTTRFCIKLKVVIRLSRGNECTIKDNVIERLSSIRGFEVISTYFNEVNIASNTKGLERTKYTTLAIGLEKLIRKYILLCHNKEFSLKNTPNTISDASFDKILNFLENTLKLHSKNYIQPIRELNVFNNSEKHNISARGSLKELEKFNYSGIIEYFIDLIEASRSITT